MEPESGTETADGSLRSLEDAGLTEAEVFTDMQGYYTDCYDQIFLIDGATHIKTYWFPEYVEKITNKLRDFFGANL